MLNHCIYLYRVRLLFPDCEKSNLIEKYHLPAVPIIICFTFVDGMKTFTANINWWWFTTKVVNS